MSADDAQKRAPGEHAIALTAEAASFLNDLEEHPLDPPREIKAVHFGENPRFDDAQKPVDLDKLERLAKAATPGEWEHDTDRDHDGIGWSYVRMPDDGAHPRMDARHNDAAFIAAANPQAVLALIARLRALSGVVSETYCVSCDHPACGALFEVAFQPRSDVTLYCPKHAAGAVPTISEEQDGISE